MTVKVICDRCGGEEILPRESNPPYANIEGEWVVLCKACIKEYQVACERAVDAHHEVIKSWLTGGKK